jgi:hypothetical protein
MRACAQLCWLCISDAILHVHARHPQDVLLVIADADATLLYATRRMCRADADDEASLVKHNCIQLIITAPCRLPPAGCAICDC